MKKINTEAIGNAIGKAIEVTAKKIERVADNPGKAAVGILGVALVGHGANAVRKLAKNNVNLKRNATGVYNIAAKAVVYGSLTLVAIIANGEIMKRIGVRVNEDELDSEDEELDSEDEDEKEED